MVQAVLQRLELMLELRVQEAVTKLLRDHTQTLAAHLRKEIADVVHACVLRAIKEESAPQQLPPKPKIDSFVSTEQPESAARVNP